jgi:boron transporter
MRTRRIVDHVVEQRVSNLAQGLLTLGTMTGPLLIVLGLIPQGVLAGLFFVMGVQALQANGITLKILFLCRDASLTPSAEVEPLKRIERRWVIWAFVGLELVGFGATFAITQFIAAIGFPVIILALVPVRTWILPRWFTREELDLLDQPTASPFTMESCGGVHGLRSENDSRSDSEAEGADEQEGEQGNDKKTVKGNGKTAGEHDNGVEGSNTSVDDAEKGQAGLGKENKGMRSRRTTENGKKN